MSKQGEKSRKLAALSQGKGVRPPKFWFKLMEKLSKKQYKSYEQRRIGQIVGGIWKRLSIKSKKSIVKKYQR